jgi:hypothetical protein
LTTLPTPAAIIAAMAVIAVINSGIIPLGDHLTMAEVRLRPSLDFARMRLWGSIAFLFMSTLSGFAVARLGIGMVPVALAACCVVAAFVALAAPEHRGDSVPQAEELDPDDVSARARLLWFAIIASALINASHASIAQAQTLQSNNRVQTIHVLGNRAQINTAFDQLNATAKIASIQLSNNDAPVVLSQTQVTDGLSTIQKIQSDFSLDITGVSVANAVTYAATLPVHTISLVATSDELAIATSVSHEKYESMLRTDVENGLLKVWFDTQGTKWVNDRNRKLKVYMKLRVFSRTIKHAKQTKINSVISLFKTCA